ncbi:MAG: SusC/RagA family TonB-linked outer membrane protein [Mucinivorans sp.]
MKNYLPGWRALGSALMLIFTLSITESIAQNPSVTGSVVDKTDGMPVIGAMVKVDGTDRATLCDVDGKFTIAAPADGQLTISFLGYKSQIVAVAGRTDLGLIKLEEDAQLLEKVIITGYGGTTSRSRSTASIATVPEKIFATGAYANPSAALAGAVPGLQVTTTSGRPGSVSSFTLRGGTVLDGSGSPLIMVDGQLRGSMADINADDIADMQVLKDAAATAIYGARANNGVILITTKRGKMGRASISASAKVGLNFQTKPWEVLNAADYLSWGRRGIMESLKYDNEQLAKLTALGNPLGTGNDWKMDGNYSGGGVWSTQFLTDENRHLLKEGWQTIVDPYTGKDLLFTDNSYADYAFNNPAMTQDYNVSVSGGNEKGSYYASFGYFDEQAQTLNNWYSRLNFMTNGDYQIAPWLKSESSFKFTHSTWRDWMHTSENNYFARMYAVPPTVRLRNSAGELLLGPNVGDGYPGYNEDKNIQDYRTDQFTFSQALVFQILPNLTLRPSAIIMYDESFKETFAKDQRNGYLSTTNPAAGWNRSRNTAAEFNRYLRQTYNIVAKYNEDFNGSKHKMNLLVGGEYYDQFQIGMSGSGSGAPTDNFMDLALTSNAAGKRAINSWHDQYRIMSLLGSASYDYDGKYLFSFTFREDGYSTLLGSNRWGFFPGVSTAWVLSREKWMDASRNWLSFLKLRASYGVNGNVSGIGSYTLQGAYGSTSYNNQVGFLMSTLPAAGIRWEKSNTFEVGLDAGFLDGRINLQVAYYNRRTDDLIANVNIPISQGFTTLRTNNGSVGNQGIEVSVSATPIKTKDWQWTADFNMTWNKNKVIKLPYNGNENNRQGGTQIWDPNAINPATGQRGSLVWVGGTQEGAWLQDQVIGYEAIDLFRTQADLDAVGNRIDLVRYSEIGFNTAAKNLLGPSRYNALTAAEKAKYFPLALGDVNFRDMDGNDTIDTRDRKVLGKTTPSIFGGLSTTLTWKNLSLYIRTDFAFDFVQIDWFRSWMLGAMQGQYNTTTDVRDTWTPENINAKYPLYYNSDQVYKNNYRQSSLMLYQGDYLCLREVALTYSFPKAMLERAKIQNVSLSLSGQNLAYWTASKNINKETGGVVSGSYGVPITMLVSAKITF